MNLGIDIGATGTKLAIVQNKQIIFHQVIKTDFQNCKKWINNVLITAQKIAKNYPFTKVAIATAGIINEQGQVIGANESAKNYIGTDWKKHFNDYFKKPIFTFACNDASALAYYALPSKPGTALCLTLGTGLGLSLIINNQVYNGQNFLAGQVGSVTWNKTQNLDQVLSATILQSKINKLAKQKVYFQDLAKHYQNNKQIKQLVNQYVFNLAHLIVLISSLLELKKVIIGGGLSYSGSFLLDILRTHLKKLMPAIWKALPIIEYAKAKNDANILGLFAS